jgi:hypothetical protein
MERPKCCGGGKVDESIRTVHINAGDPHQDYLGNYTRTTKYTLLTFFPKALFEQASILQNVSRDVWYKFTVASKG